MITRKDVKAAINWINNSGAVDNTDREFMSLVATCNKLRKPDMTTPGWDDPANYIPMSNREWEDKVYYYYNPDGRITIKKVIEECGLLDGWIEEQFQEWDEDPGNDFDLSEKKGRNYISQAKARIIALEMIEKYYSYLGDIWDSWDEFCGYVDMSLKESNDYWDIFEEAIFK